jgi:hypothetical protein
MKISKSYLKQIIKEEIEKQVSSTRKSIVITPEEFLSLTTTPEEYERLAKNYNAYLKGSYDPFKLAKEVNEEPYLVIDNNGKVINHEGRNRAYILKQKKINSYEVNISFPKGFDINKPNLMIFGQYDDEKSITINKKEEENVNIDFSSLLGEYIMPNIDLNDIKLNKLKYESDPRNILFKKIINLYNSINDDLRKKVPNPSEEEKREIFRNALQTVKDGVSQFIVYQIVDGKPKTDRELKIVVGRGPHDIAIKPNTTYGIPLEQFKSFVVTKG